MKKKKEEDPLKEVFRVFGNMAMPQEEKFIQSTSSMLVQQAQRNKALWAELADRLGVEWQNKKGFSKEVPELFQAILDKYEVKK